MKPQVRHSIFHVEGLDSPEEDDGHCVIDDPFSKQNGVEDCELFRLDDEESTLMRDMAATVSVAQSTLLRSMIYLRGSLWKKRESMPHKKKVIKT